MAKRTRCPLQDGTLTHGRVRGGALRRRYIPFLAALVAGGLCTGAAAPPIPVPSSSGPSSGSGPGGPTAPFPSPPGNETSPPTSTDGDLTLALSLLETTVSSGQPVQDKVALANIGSANETVPWAGCNPWLEVTNASAAVTLLGP